MQQLVHRLSTLAIKDLSGKSKLFGLNIKQSWGKAVPSGIGGSDDFRILQRVRVL